MPPGKDMQVSSRVSGSFPGGRNRSSHYKPEEAHSKDAGEPKFTWRKIRFGEALPHGQGQVCSAESLHVT